MKEYKIKINGNNYNVTIDEVEDNVAKVEVNGTPYNVEFEKPISKPKTISVVNKPAAAPAAGPAPASKPAAAPAAGNGATVNSPLPGVVLEIKVKDGDKVTKGQTIIVLEAMKMENEIFAPCSGSVAQVLVSKGSTVDTGTPLVTIS